MAGGGENVQIVSDDKFIIIYDWIHQYLKLNGNEAEAFALIYSFHQKDGFYGGSAKYISERLYIDLSTAKRLLNKLEKYEYITKEKGNYKTRSKYFINVKYIKSLVQFLDLGQNVPSKDITLGAKCYEGSGKMPLGVVAKCHPSNKYSIKYSNNNNIYAHSENERESESKEDTQKEDDNPSSKCTTMKQDTKNKAIAKKELRERQFKEFWQIYPRKVNKKQAIKKWQKINPDDELFKKIIQALNTTISTEWKNRDEQYIPHASTWLNNERWNDELKTKQPIAQEKEKPKVVYTPVVEDLMADYKEDDTQNTSKNPQQAHQ